MRSRWIFLIVVMFIAVFGLAVTPVISDETLYPINVRVGLIDIPSAGGEGHESIEARALRRIFEILGIPYERITDVSLLERYKVVYTSGKLHNSVVGYEVTDALYDYVEMGGVLVSAGEVGNRLHPVFGIENYVPSNKRYRLSFRGNDASLKYIDHVNERTISLGNGEDHFYDEVIWSYGYVKSQGARTLAIFDDDSIGFVTNNYGRGKAYLLGLSYTEAVLLPQIGGDFEAQRKYVNSVEPSADVIMLIIRAIYEAHYSPFVYLSTIPYARSTALILTHDVDAQTAFVDSLKYARLEERYGVKSTFFENTKYFVDWMDIDYYNIEENVDAIRELKNRGWDIGSHTVSHYKQLSSIAEGDPNVTFTDYDPLNNVTVQGEVRVSKELLDRDIPEQNTIAFRAGDLEYPYSLVKVLEESGYMYNSTYSANDVLTAFPFLALRERNLGSDESSVFEFPVTLDDALGYLTPDTVNEAVDLWLEVIRANRDNEAITVLLIHPSDTRDKTYKLEAQESVMEKIKEMGGWMGDLTTYGNFWRDRHTTLFDTYNDKDGALIIRIKKKAESINPALGFVVGNAKDVRVVVQDSGGNILKYLSESRDSKSYLGRSEKTQTR
ncbi:MAG: polysaccharide deacetylase family protein [Spirochaetota bacterium]|nr:MAG: polysaccharide deacetylase family protein [Spirochaetota bacterium]